jgi:hypothetical protein
MTKWRKTSYSLLITSLLAFASIISASAQTTSGNRVEILSPERIVHMYRESWNSVTRDEQLLNPNNWLGTGSKSLAELKYLKLNLIYRQDEKTFSQFVTIEVDKCGFNVNEGKTLHLENQSRQQPEPGCYQISGEIVAIPPGFPSDIAFHNKQVEDTETGNSAAAFFVSRNRDNGETIVGVLASPLAPVTVRSREDIAEPVTFNDIESNETVDQIELDTGEFAFILDDGRFVRGEFSIPRFYEDNPILTVGLLDRPEDIAYFEALEGEERELFAEIREATRQALEEYPEPGPFEVNPLLYPGLNSPSIPQCQVYQEYEGNSPMITCF